MFIAVPDSTEMFQVVPGKDRLIPLVRPLQEGDVLVLDKLDVDERQVSGYLEVQYVVMMPLIRSADDSEEHVYLREGALQELISDWTKQAEGCQENPTPANAP